MSRDRSPSRERSSGTGTTTATTSDRRDPIPESLRGPLFVAGVVGGMTVLALGFGLLVLGVSVDTRPPAPYVYSTTDKYLVVAVAVGALALGGGIVRAAARMVGW